MRTSFFVLVLCGAGLLSAEALAQKGQSSSGSASAKAPTARARAETGGIGLFFGGGFPLGRDEPNMFRIGPRGWLWLSSKDRLKLGLSLPIGIAVGERQSRFGSLYSVTQYEIAPSLKGALQLSELVRPYAEFGLGAALVTQRYDFGRFETEESRGSMLIRTVVGAELTPRRKAEGLVVTVELVGIHARAFGFDGVDMVLLMGIGYEL